MTYYAEWKLLHMACAAISLALFLLRATWKWHHSPRLQQRWVRIVPHVVDTVFLGSGLVLAALLRQYPLVDAWLSAKFFGLIGYIILGSMALKRARTRAQLALAVLAALATFAYIVGVAWTKDPRSWAVLIS